MTRSYVILINGVLAARHLTHVGALKHVKELQSKGLKAVIAYTIMK